MDTPTRRALLGGSAAAVAAIAATGGVAAAGLGSRSNHRLRRAIALHDRVNDICERFDVEIEGPTRNAVEAAIATYQDEAPPPHEEVPTTFVNAFGDTVRLSTDWIGADAVAKKVVADPTWSDMGDETWRQAHRELADANDRRKAVLAAQAERKRAFEAGVRGRFRISEVCARSDALGNRRYQLWKAVLATPSGDWSDVVAKLAFVSRTIGDDEVGQHEFAAIAADVRRLAEEA